MILTTGNRLEIPRRYRLAGFLAVSGLIHLFILSIQPAQHRLELGSGNQNHISVYLPDNSASGIKANKVESHKLQPKSVDKAHTENSEQTTQIDSLSDLKLRGSTDRKQILGKIKLELARYFSYPPQAMRRGIQGQVIIGFYVNNNGKIHSIKVNQSSGYKLLDEAAVGAFMKLAKVYSDTQHDSSGQYNIPVQFKLTGG